MVEVLATCLLSLMHWANCALYFERQRTHIAYTVEIDEAPPLHVIIAQQIYDEPGDAIPDSILDMKDTSSDDASSNSATSAEATES